MTTSGAAHNSGAYDYKPSTAAFPPIVASEQFHPSGMPASYYGPAYAEVDPYAANDAEEYNSWAIWSLGLALLGGIAVISLGYAYVGIAIAVLGVLSGFAGLIKGSRMHSGHPRFGRSMAGLLISTIVIFLGVCLVLVVEQL